MTNIFNKVLLTGANGQLARELLAQCPDLKGLTKRELDITNETMLREYILCHSIKGVINCAAYTNVDAAEDHLDQALSVNSDAVKVITELAEELDLSLIHISTDYVFDGKAKSPYKEEDRINPMSNYGKSKAKGESYILKSSLTKAAIIRTSWLYGAEGPNFVTKILDLAKK